MKNLKLLVILAFMAISESAFTQTTQVSGLITNIQMFTSNLGTYDVNDTGLFGISMDEIQPACGSGVKRILISSDHPLFSAVVSAAYTAKVSGKAVTIWHTNTCSLRSNSWDFALFEVLNN